MTPDQYPQLFEALALALGPLVLFLVGGFLALIVAAGVALTALLVAREILP